MQKTDIGHSIEKTGRSKGKRQHQKIQQPVKKNEICAHAST